VRSHDKSEKHRAAYHDHTGRYGDECTIDQPNYGSPFSRRKDRTPCGHYLQYPHICDPHTADNRALLYWAPARQDERTYLKNATKDYNTFGDVDEDYFLQEKTMNATYGGGYWD
jgi:hypothetical protein